MEDRNMLAADCVVISCCCQCLILQLVVFLLLKLPYKVLQRIKHYLKKKLWQGKREEKVMKIIEQCYRDESIEIHGGSVGIQVGEFPNIDVGLDCGGCMEEVERVLEELIQKGEFAFGSFWGGEETESFPSQVAKEKCDKNLVQCHIIEMVGSFSYS